MSSIGSKVSMEHVGRAVRRRGIRTERNGDARVEQFGHRATGKDGGDGAGIVHDGRAGLGADGDLFVGQASRVGQQRAWAEHADIPGDADAALGVAVLGEDQATFLGDLPDLAGLCDGILAARAVEMLLVHGGREEGDMQPVLMAAMPAIGQGLRRRHLLFEAHGIVGPL
jgi:hypothetical protein